MINVFAFRRLAHVIIALMPCVAMNSTQAQSRAFTACTPGTLTACVDLQFTATTGSFEIALRTLGIIGAPSLPVSSYNLILGTGTGAATTPTTTSIVPLAVGGAVVSDASPWDMFDTGDLLFLSAINNRGVGGCAVGADVDGFGQAATTCGSGQFVVFGFTPTALFNPDLFQILNLEMVLLSNPTDGVSCGAFGDECVITGDTSTPVNVVPEAQSAVLLAFGMSLLGAMRFACRRRS